jgi:hypothetical protein
LGIGEQNSNLKVLEGYSSLKFDETVGDDALGLLFFFV